MKTRYTVKLLDGPDAWELLAQALGGHGSDVVRNTIRHLRVLRVKSYVLEDKYIDRDYSADYLYFYARTFRTHDRHCKRVHFFSDDISPLLRRPLSTDRLRQIQDFADTNYCGFCVVRPLPTAPIVIRMGLSSSLVVLNETVLKGRVRSAFDMETTVTCRADFGVNLLGVDLQVTGASFLQQDARVGACAQVAIWAGMRHMHARYKYNWISVADITRFATPTTEIEAISLPAGSDFLTSERMIRGISEAGYQPLCFRRPDIDRAILPYVESGIPVILGLKIGEAVGHAVTVIGRVFARQDSPSHNAIDYVPAYPDVAVEDQQQGLEARITTSTCVPLVHPGRQGGVPVHLLDAPVRPTPARQHRGVRQMQVRPEPDPFRCAGDDQEVDVGWQVHQQFDEDVLQDGSMVDSHPLRGSRSTWGRLTLTK